MNPAYIIKLSGTALVVVVCALIGYEKAMTLKARCSFLKEFIGTVEMLKTEISFVRMTIDCVFAKLETQPKTGKIFAQAKQQMREKGLEQAWRQSVRENAPVSCLTQEDISVLECLGEGLGKSDISGQIAHTQYCRELLERQLLKAAEVQKKNGGLYQKGGILVGIFIAILLL